MLRFAFILSFLMHVSSAELSFAKNFYANSNPSRCIPPKFENIEKTITVNSANIVSEEMINNQLKENQNDIQDNNKNNENKNITLSACIFSTKDFLLFNQSLIPVKLKINTCYKNKEKRICCSVVHGEWQAFDGEKDVRINVPQLLQIEHILPFSYIRENMKNCQIASLYYNYLPNLILAPFDLEKNNNQICKNTESCLQQKKICKQMSIKFKDRTLCVEIEKYKSTIQ